MRHKPSNEARAATHAANEADYTKLAEQVVKAIVLRKKDIYLAFPYFAVLSEDWPRGVLVKKSDDKNIFKCKTYKVAAWLHKHGHLPEDAHGIMLAMRNLTYREAAINKLLIDSGKSDEYNSNSEVKEDKEDRNGTDSCDDES